MTSYDLLISCASWEERSEKSILFHQEKNQFDWLLLFGVEEFSHLYGKTYFDKEKLINGEIQYISSFDDVATWKRIQNLFDENNIYQKNVLFDVSTMPRYLIWYLLHFLVSKTNQITYCYFSPEKYEECDWLTEEPMSPRLVLKHSGIHLPNRNTILVVQSGFDTERVSQLINVYEPEKVILGVQTGEQLNNVSKNLKRHKEILNYQEIEHFPINAFGKDHGYSAIEEKVLQYKESKNIIMASFGPKLVAIEMFKINQKIPEAGLVDVPVRNYNQRYSLGINLDSLQKGSIES
ncbi:hypothetical protein [Teredinibacter turnerae]|uniref:hypothetical protein n=1 Tax=Teredinibacter turnerae TaxID=2426 RepID=UPI000419E554|nr:hypothetical protein [Teredinibacter turnerae]